jgi:uncharacterized protein (DUF302 family)
MDMIVSESASDHAGTCQRVVDAIARRGLILFARIDHAGGAREVGLELADEQVMIFGHARTGTPLMRADPRIGIELPLRILVWSRGERVLVGYRDPRDWQSVYAVGDHVPTLEAMAGVLEAIAAEATSADDA